MRNQSILLVSFLAVTLSGCTTRKETPEDLREKTADATAQLKQNAKAVAEGVREGWNRNKPLDLNNSTKNQIASLPGITGEQADRIVAGRPYEAPHQLVTRRILSEAEYAKISDEVTASP